MLELIAQAVQNQIDFHNIARQHGISVSVVQAINDGMKDLEYFQTVEKNLKNLQYVVE